MDGKETDSAMKTDGRKRKSWIETEARKNTNTKRRIYY
jgi:hypothetical protein